MNDKERLIKIVEEISPELKKLALDIHANPELGLEEFKACEWQTELLKKYGFEIEKNFCDIATAYKASYKVENPDVKIAFLAEYDALPGLGHGCGHNLIAMIACGCGIASSEFSKKYNCQIDVIGTPAEETAGAKVPMSKCGVFKGYDAIMMAHPFFVNCDSINTIAIDAYRVEFFGKPAHASASPHDGVNALDAMVNLFNLVNALRQQVTPDVRIHGIITNGGSAVNVIPDYTSADFNLRANRTADVKALGERFKKCVEGAAIATGCDYKAEFYDENFKDTNSNQVLNALAAANLDQFATTPLMRSRGAYMPGSSDLGDVSYEAPAIQVCCKVGDYPNPLGGAHTPEMVAAACSEYGLTNALNFVKGLSLTAIDVMTKPEIRAQIADEFSRVNE